MLKALVKNMAYSQALVLAGGIAHVPILITALKFADGKAKKLHNTKEVASAAKAAALAKVQAEKVAAEAAQAKAAKVAAEAAAQAKAEKAAEAQEESKES